MATAVGGLESVEAADTAITWIDGQAGELRYRGYAVGELAQHCSFEEVAYLLWHGELPSVIELRRLHAMLRTERERSAPILKLITDLPLGAHPLDVIRYLVSWDALKNPLAWDNDDVSNLAKAAQFAAWFPPVVAAYHRRRRGKDFVAPRADLGTAAGFLYMLRGEEPAEIEVRTLNTSLVLHADHELNASTFAARVTIATQSNLHAAVASALGTLAGPRHGGASDRVIRMLEEIGTPSRAEEYVAAELRNKRRIMGFGHRVYRTADPRSHYLRAMAGEMLTGTEHAPWMDVLDRLETIMARDKNLFPNVDLYAAVVNHELGIAPDFYTAAFAISRIVGWTAHSMEQLNGRMIRPAARYVGLSPRRMPARVNA